MNRRRITTADGTYTLELSEGGETYHSRHGAVQESKHVFIGAGFNAIAVDRHELRVLEVGFGTGLNALLTLIACHYAQIKVHYTGLEPLPLSVEEIEGLNYVNDLSADIHCFECLHEVPVDGEEVIDANFTLRRSTSELQAYAPQEKFDLIYYDAFGPNTQSELWTLTCFEKCLVLLKEGGVLVTYCAKGQVRRNMIEAGFEVERLPGPPGKREMLRAWKR